MSDFRADYRGIGEMLCMPGMVVAMHGKAELMAGAARATAPVGPETDGIHYRDAFEVSSGVREGASRRAYGQVENASEHAAAVEFGNFRTRPQTIEAHHVLGRALDAAKE